MQYNIYSIDNIYRENNSSGCFSLMMRVGKLSRSLFSFFEWLDCKNFTTLKHYHTAVLPHCHFKALKYGRYPRPHWHLLRLFLLTSITVEPI